MKGKADQEMEGRCGQKEKGWMLMRDSAASPQSGSFCRVVLADRCQLRCDCDCDSIGNWRQRSGSRSIQQEGAVPRPCVRCHLTPQVAADHRPRGLANGAHQPGPSTSGCHILIFVYVPRTPYSVQAQKIGYSPGASLENQATAMTGHSQGFPLPCAG